jgi:hypothetical protein
MNERFWLRKPQGKLFVFSSSQLLAIIHSNKGKFGYYFVPGSQLQQYALSFDIDFAGFVHVAVFELVDSVNKNHCF